MKLLCSQLITAANVPTKYPTERGIRNPASRIMVIKEVRRINSKKEGKGTFFLPFAIFNAIAISK